jgi:hypothetical protein
MVDTAKWSYKLRFLNYAKITCVYLCIFAFSYNALAFISRVQNILSRSAKTHGSKVYQIDLEIKIKGLSGEPETVAKETWWIDGTNRMRLRATGGRTPETRWEVQALYLNGKRYWVENQGKLRQLPLSSDFIEPYSHYRDSLGFTQALIRSEILTSAALNRAKPILTAADYAQLDHAPEPYVRLSRSSTIVTFALGEVSAADAHILKPTLWIDQDTHVIRKLRFKSQSEITYDDYSEFDKNFSYPKLRTVKWNQETALLQTLTVTLAKPEKLTGLFSLDEFEKRFNKESTRRAPVMDARVMEFYSRFR